MPRTSTSRTTTRRTPSAPRPPVVPATTPPELPSKPKATARSATSRGDVPHGRKCGVPPGPNAYRMLPGGILAMRRPLRLAVVAVAAMLLCAVPASAQYPTGGQYPTGQYPPNQYPNQYPPGQYPNTYPPGLPMPNIHLPSKKPKPDKGEEVRTTVASVDGSLRRLGEKDLLLETGKGTILRFRLLAKTKFENKAGETMRDSLLHLGDQISVQVGPDDPETAFRAILVRSGTPAERAAGEQSIPEGGVRAPVAGDLGKPRTVTTRRSEEHTSELQ